MKKKILCLFFAVLLLLSIFPLSVFADETTSGGSESELEHIDLSQTSIEYDFEYIFFNAFKLEDYKPNAFKSDIELITMTETQTTEQYIELYIYVYNPSQKTIYDNSANMVTMSTYEGTGEFEKYEKYQLERVQVEYSTKNTAVETNASIIKYKVTDYSNRTVSVDRSYGISEIELVSDDGVQSYPLGKTFTYTFTDGEDGMLTVNYGTFEVMEFDVDHTYYRVLTNHNASADEYKEIRSVYFAVNNEKVKNAGVLDSIDITFQEYITKPILIVDDNEVYTEFEKYIGQSFPDDFEYSFGSSVKSSFFLANPFEFSLLIIDNLIAKGLAGWHRSSFNYVINPSELPTRFVRGNRNFLESLLTFVDASYGIYSLNKNGNYTLYNNEIEKLYWLFELESYSRLSGDELIKYAYKYSGSGQDWSDELFAEIKEVQNLTITRDDLKESGEYYSFEENKFAQWFSRYYFNVKFIEKEASIEFNMLDTFLTKDLDLSDEELCEKYLIDINDIGKFRTFVKKNADSTIYILRYDITDTVIEEGSLFSGNFIDINALPAILGGFTGKCYCCTSSLAQTTLIKGFDIIQLTYVNELEEYTVFPVGITPTDHAPDLEHLSKPDSDYNLDNELEKFIKLLTTFLTIIIIIAVIALIVYAVFALSPYLSMFFSRMGWGGGSNVNTNVNINLSDEVEKKKNEVKKDEEKTD